MKGEKKTTSDANYERIEKELKNAWARNVVNCARFDGHIQF